MHLVTRAAGTRRSFARHGMLEQVRDLGRRLEYVLARYDHLVRDMAGTDVPSADFEGRIHLVNREIGQVAHRLQDLFVLEHEARRAEAYAEFEQVAAARPKHGTVVATPPRPRRTAVDRLGPIVTAPPLPDAPRASRLASAQ
jgi:hypothetical protein